MMMFYLVWVDNIPMDTRVMGVGKWMNQLCQSDQPEDIDEIQSANDSKPKWWWWNARSDSEEHENDDELNACLHVIYVQQLCSWFKFLLLLS